MTAYPAVVTFVLPPNSTIADSDIYIAVLGIDPATCVTNSDGSETCQFGYLDFKTNAMVTSSGTFSFAQSMAWTLSKIKAQNNAYTINIPLIKSARIYMAFGENFTAGFGQGGPPMNKNYTILYDKIELDTNGNPNINATNVDFYGVSFEIEATDTNTGKTAKIGYTNDRATIISAFNAIKAPTGTQHNGNSDIFKQMVFEDANNNVYRILAPKSAGLTDWAGSTLDEQIDNAYLASHFWDDYVNTLCWKPNRKFSFYSKLYPNDTTIYYGEIDSAGTTLNLYTDSNYSVPYAPVPSLPRPSNPWKVPDFTPPVSGPSLYQNINSAIGPIDWGFLLFANTGFTSGEANYWATDPLAMAIMVSICRGIMHSDNGTTDWIDATKYYTGTGTSQSPLFCYSKILHDLSIDNLAYVLSYDDVYGSDPTIYFNGYPNITVTFAGFASTSSTTNDIRANRRVDGILRH